MSRLVRNWSAIVLRGLVAVVFGLVALRRLAPVAGLG